MSSQVEMPDGSNQTYSSSSIQELKRRVAAAIGVESDEVAILDDQGRPVPESSSPPARTRVIPKPKWG